MPVFLFFIALFGLSGCAPDTTPRRVGDYRTVGELRVATRLDAISYRQEAPGEASGFEHDLLQKLGQRLDVTVRFVVYPDVPRALDAVLNGEVHLAAAGIARNERFPLRWSAPLRDVDYVLVGRSDGREIDREDDLAGRTISMRRGSAPVEAVERISRRVAGLTLHFPTGLGDQELLEELGQGELDLVATDRVHFALAAQTDPRVVIAYDLPVRSEIAWALPIDAASLAAEVDVFLEEARKSALLARTADRYFGHIRRLDDRAVAVFLGHLRTRLPAYRPHFHEAQTRTGVDWRFLAALAYQESRWDPLATSRTGVRGMMMLTSETADRLGVGDRLDARDSILGGARYFSMLRDQLPGGIAEPDRSWIAVAAYNLGMGHMNGARAIARGMGRDDTTWWDLKAVLPLLSRPEYAARLKSGPARGGEAVIMTENIRNFHGILARLEPPYTPPLQPPGLKLGRAGP
ncbi:membrane-bound lytic murein transglycosylase MltF [Azoarcus sp. PA01]|nr:membrane-bound lytic murein transglycosylase MltF [Azoarcus sp. PA01]